MCLVATILNTEERTLPSSQEVLLNQTLDKKTIYKCLKQQGTKANNLSKPMVAYLIIHN